MFAECEQLYELRVLGNQRSGIRVCHINAQRLVNKIEEFRYFLLILASMLYVCPKKGFRFMLVIR